MTDPWYIDPVHMTIRLVLAMVLGGLIGLEREQANHPAGFRTHILVCLGSALIMMLSIFGFSAFVNEPNVRLDPARLAAQVVSGIGFLGAGAIMSNGLSVRGLTTAASLWVVAAIGLSVGAGFYYPAILCTVFVLISLWVLNQVERKYFWAKKVHSITIHSVDQPGTLGQITSVLGKLGVDIRKVAMEEDDKENEKRIYITLTVKIPKQHLLIPVTEEIRRLKGVIGVTAE